jgi:hypothetical protein
VHVRAAYELRDIRRIIEDPPEDLDADDERDGSLCPSDETLLMLKLKLILIIN